MFAQEAQVLHNQRDTMRIIEVFAFTQALDFLTTLIGLRLGAHEVNAFIRLLMELGPVTGLAICKALAFGMAGLFLYLNRLRLIVKINYIFAFIVLWNLFNILIMVSRIS
jgi:hypothetical protein